MISPKFFGVGFVGRPRIDTLYAHPDRLVLSSKVDGEFGVVHLHFVHKGVRMEQDVIDTSRLTLMDSSQAVSYSAVAVYVFCRRPAR